jgi:hypothetical protein
MLYRSPFMRGFLTAMGLIVGVILAFGDGGKWRSTPSLRWLEQVPVPLQTWGLLFIAYGLLLLDYRSRPFGYALGAFLFAVFTLSLLATLAGNDPKNIVTVGAMADTVVFHVYSIRTAEYQKLSR